MTFEEASAGVGIKIITWIHTFVQLIGNIFNNEQSLKLEKRESHTDALNVNLAPRAFTFPPTPSLRTQTYFRSSYVLRLLPPLFSAIGLANRV